MNAATVRSLAVGFVSACLVGGIWFSAQPSHSSASEATSPAEPFDDGAEEMEFAESMNSDTLPAVSSQQAGPQKNVRQQHGGALSRLDAAVKKIEARYASIWEMFARMNSHALQDVTRFRRLNLTLKDGAIAIETKEVLASVADHVQWMKKSLASAKRIRSEVQAGVRTFGLDATALQSSHLDPAVNAIIEMAYLSETGSQPGVRKTKQQKRRVCELLAVLKPYLPEDRAEKAREAEAACRAMGN